MNMWLLWSLWFVLTGVSALPTRCLELLGQRHSELARFGHIKVQGLPCLRLGPVTFPLIR